MKLLCKDYTFNPVLKTISIDLTDQVTLANVLLITNVTSNIIIYNFANPLLGGSMQNNILTLDYDTTSMSLSDELQIFLDIDGAPSSEATLSALNEQIALMKRLLMLLNPIATQDSANRQRVLVDNILGGSVIVSQGTASNLNATVSQSTASNLNANIGIVSNIAGYGGSDPRFHLLDTARIAYSTSIRSNLKST